MRVFQDKLKSGGSVNSGAIKTSDYWSDLLYVLNCADISGHIELHIGLTSKMNHEFDNGIVHIEMLAPSKYLTGLGPGSIRRDGKPITSNSVSAVLRLLVGKQQIILFAGDLDGTGLNVIERWGTELQAAFLVYPHHGGRSGTAMVSSFARRLCALMTPETVVFSIGRGSYGMPRPDVVTAIKESRPLARIACTQLSEHCADKLPAVEPSHLSGLFAQGREGRKCCTGSIELAVKDTVTVTSPPSQHYEFIGRNAPTALCMEKPGS